MTGFYLGVLGVAVALSALLIYLNEFHHLFRTDVFPNAAAKWLAYAWMTLLLVIMSFLVAYASTHATPDLANVTFWSLFNFHIVLMIFLFGWWLLSGMPPLRRFLNLDMSAGPQIVLLGIGLGVVGWAVTIAASVVIGLILMKTGVLDPGDSAPPMIAWMANLAPWKKVLLVLSAMTVEEAFFRAWLQKRVGLVLSTIVFALAHAGYGAPALLIGVTLISLVLGYAFYRTRNLIPCIIAHGVFDAIQLFVVVPLALQFSGAA